MHTQFYCALCTALTVTYTWRHAPQLHSGHPQLHSAESHSASAVTIVYQYIKVFLVRKYRVRRGSAGCGVAQQGAAWLSRVRRGLDRVRRGSDNSASACCMASPSSNLGSASQRRQWGVQEWHRRVLCIKYCMYARLMWKQIKRVAACHQTLKKKKKIII